MILHIAHAEKFIEPFIEIIETHFDVTKHHFVVKINNQYLVTAKRHVTLIEPTIPKWKEFLIYSFRFHRADKIILHGIFDHKTLFILFIQPWLLKKCYWVIWGGDLYNYQYRGKIFRSNQFEIIRSFVIKRIGNLVTYIKGDYELVKKWYGATGKFHECFIYPSNLYKDYDIPQKSGNSINIIVGNSSDPTNNHFEILDKLEHYKEQDILIYCPLSYGDPKHAEQVIEHGTTLFGDKFIPLLEFIPFEKYLVLLGQIDIAIFAHKRQQAMGNIITLLGLGKKVFMRRNITTWELFNSIDVKIFDFNSLEVSLIDKATKRYNQRKIRQYFSKNNYLQQLHDLFDC